jgi:hypothetical protein
MEPFARGANYIALGQGGVRLARDFHSVCTTILPNDNLEARPLGKARIMQQ